MWTRKELKEKAKEALHRNYWKAVLVGLIFMVVAGSAGVSSGASFSGFGSNSHDKEEFMGVTVSGGSENEYIDILNDQSFITIMAVVLIAVLIVALILCVVMFVIDIFVLNPFFVGGQRFFNRSLTADGDLNDIVSGFNKNYKNTIKIMFLKDLYILLWTLLFIIPGIIKSYEYMMVPYILGDNPDISKDEAFALSKQMMMGQKWNAFVLDLSFIGWELLSSITCGILSIFYVTPYRQYTNAALYRRLSGKEEVLEAQA